MTGMNIIVPKILLIGIVILILVSAPVMALTREEVILTVKHRRIRTLMI
jgi:hypothetical protein